jgi:hypothetical protein
MRHAVLRCSRLETGHDGIALFDCRSKQISQRRKKALTSHKIRLGDKAQD